MFRRKRQHHQMLEISDDVLTVTEDTEAYVPYTPDRLWTTLLWWVSLLVLAVFAGRVFYLTVVKGEEYRAVAQGNSTRAVSVIAPRGKILDQFGQVLATNVPSLRAVVLPHALPREESERHSVLAQAAAVVDLSVDEFVGEYGDILSSRSSLSVVLKDPITQEEALRLQGQARDLPGVAVQKTAQRSYQDGLIFSHIIGYEGAVRPDDLEEYPDYLLIDRIGKDGVEKTYEQALHGTHGTEYYVVDARGRVVREAQTTPAQPGADVYLTIDAELQKVVFDSLQSALERAETETAAAMAIDPRTGAVRALVSLPSYDNNLFAQGISSQDYTGLITDADRPLFNRAIGGVYAPGSTLKPVIAGAALAEQIIDPRREIESRGGISVGSFFFGDWRVHGFTDLRRAIAVSSDVYFYSIGGGYGGIAGLGIERMTQYNGLFGYGQVLGIDLPGEVAGFLPDSAWKEATLGEKWYIGNSYHASIGQGYITSTPLQVLNSVAAIANGGTLYKPYVVSHMKQPDGSTTFQAPEVLRENLLSPEILQILREGMRMTVEDGTATYLKDLSVPVAGKTGTAEFGGHDDKVHSWFVSYIPDDDPSLALVVLMEGQTNEVSSTTVPVTKKVYEWYIENRLNR